MDSLMSLDSLYDHMAEIFWVQSHFCSHTHSTHSYVNPMVMCTNYMPNYIQVRQVPVRIIKLRIEYPDPVEQLLTNNQNYQTCRGSRKRYPTSGGPPKIDPDYESIFSEPRASLMKQTCRGPLAGYSTSGGPLAGYSTSGGPPKSEPRASLVKQTCRGPLAGYPTSGGPPKSEPRASLMKQTCRGPLAGYPTSEGPLAEYPHDVGSPKIDSDYESISSELLANLVKQICRRPKTTTQKKHFRKAAQETVPQKVINKTKSSSTKIPYQKYNKCEKINEDLNSNFLNFLMEMLDKNIKSEMQKLNTDKNSDTTQDTTTDTTTDTTQDTTSDSNSSTTSEESSDEHEQTFTDDENGNEENKTSMEHEYNSGEKSMLDLLKEKCINDIKIQKSLENINLNQSSETQNEVKNETNETNEITDVPNEPEEIVHIDDNPVDNDNF
ncbi:MAG: hypothetical protein Satyrvirus2_43 [Satyrvirus sp.]|uniref:Uncharacterized protein n=1 Tax=Satyrvirus sp. TaxID=2487771 RepID=A0A3G5ACZ1_9VIRU|nr:MAG: hypothetical protein Satyrvirus2_43 [Satyrvirus sp.]